MVNSPRIILFDLMKDGITTRLLYGATLHRKILDNLASPQIFILLFGILNLTTEQRGANNCGKNN